MNAVCQCLPCRPNCKGHETDEPVCARCKGRMRGWLADVPVYYADISTVLLPGASGMGGNAKQQKISGSPAPGRVDVLNLLGPASPGTVTDPHADQSGSLPVIAVLEAWERYWRAGRDLPLVGAWPDHAAAVTGLAGFLARHLDWACANDPAIGDFHDELRKLHLSLRVALGDVAAQAKLGSCPNVVDDVPCGGRLTFAEYADGVSCRQCGEYWPRSRLLWLGRTIEDGGAA